MFRYDIRSNIKQVKKQLDDFARNQVPFATAQAINAVAVKVQAAEREAMRTTFDRPTPFTVNSVAVRKARKVNPEATVYVKPVAANYLAPYEDGGTQLPPGTSRAAFNPKDPGLLNKYGGLPRNTISRLRGKTGVFVGTVKTAGGEEIDGVWQRPKRVTKAQRARAGKRKGAPNTPRGNVGRLKLLIRFTDPQPVKKQYPFEETAHEVIERNMLPEFEKAMAKAIATAKK